MTFDRFVIVDWSAANAPRTGRDSIWIARHGCSSDHTTNAATRAAAMLEIEAEIAEALAAGERLFVGFDFAFGYPSDACFLPGEGRWTDVWSSFAATVEDDDRNRTNRFDVADRLNGMVDGAGPFWGHPWQHRGRYENLAAERPDYAALGLREKRHVDARVRSAQPVWKLAYPGSVGSQTLTGISRLERLRSGIHAADIAIWPFETAFADDLSKPITVAEIYPSLFLVDRTLGKTLDEAQVRTLATGFAKLEADGRFAAMLDGPRNLGANVRADALSHEGWIVGFADEALPL